MRIFSMGFKAFGSEAQGLKEFKKILKHRLTCGKPEGEVAK
jgi:hypothetical protein